MKIIKYLILLVVISLQLTTFCLSASKFILTNKRKEKLEFLIMALSGLVGFILFTNPVMYLI